MDMGSGMFDHQYLTCTGISSLVLNVPRCLVVNVVYPCYEPSSELGRHIGKMGGHAAGRL